MLFVYFMKKIKELSFDKNITYGIPLGNEKKWTIDIYNILDGSQSYCTD